MVDLKVLKTLQLDVKNADLQGNQLLVQLFKSAISRTLANANYREIGKTSVYIDLKHKSKIEGMNIY